MAFFCADLNEFRGGLWLRTVVTQGLGVHVSPVRTEITRTREEVGEKGRWIRELTSVVHRRFGVP